MPGTGPRVGPAWRWPGRAGGRRGGRTSARPRRLRPRCEDVHASGPRTRTAGRGSCASRGATRGGVITVYLPGAPGPDRSTRPPAGRRTGNSIQQALDEPLADAVRHGRGRRSRCWCPTSRPTWARPTRTSPSGPSPSVTTPRGRTAARHRREVAFGICRSLDSEAFPSGPGTEYSKTYFEGAADYDGPYTGKDPKLRRRGPASRSRARTSPSRWRSRSRTWTTGAPSWRWARLRSATPPSRRTTATSPLSNGPYKVESYKPNEELVLVKNDQWSADSDPGRHQYADEFVFKFDQDQAKVDEIMLSDNSDSQTAMSTSLGSDRYNDANGQLGDRWCSRPRSACPR